MIDGHSRAGKEPVAAGFTLLEVMAAVAILGFVMTAVYATWSAAINGWKRSSAVSATFQRERVVMDALTEMTRSLIFFDSPSQIYAIQGLHDEEMGDSVSFVTASDAVLPQTQAMVAGLRRVTLYLQRDDKGKPFLAIMNATALQPPDASTEGQARWLSPDVIGFGVRYRDPLKETWTEKWETPSAVPAAIEFTVAFAGSDRRTPPVIVTRAVEIPMAKTLLQVKGLQDQTSVTNQVERQDVPLLQQTGGMEAGTE